MSIFQFKQFAITQKVSAMKVGTDSLLLGALLQANSPKKVLDIGTGTGLLALMMAQRFEEAQIMAIEKEAGAAKEALQNVETSKWSNRILVINESLQTWIHHHKQQFDLIVCNPPYYDVEHHYEMVQNARATARQTHDLTFEELINGIKQLLSSAGICWLIIPFSQLSLFDQICIKNELYIAQQMTIFSKPSKKANRVIIGITQSESKIKQSEFIIYNDDNSPTEAYKKVTYAFLLWNKD